MSSKIVNIPDNKCGFDPETYAKVFDFYARDDNSTALPGKRGVKSIKKIKFRKRSLNDHLSNLYQKLKAEKPFY